MASFTETIEVVLKSIFDQSGEDQADRRYEHTAELAKKAAEAGNIAPPPSAGQKQEEPGIVSTARGQDRSEIARRFNENLRSDATPEQQKKEREEARRWNEEIAREKTKPQQQEQRVQTEKLKALSDEHQKIKDLLVLERERAALKDSIASRETIITDPKTKNLEKQIDLYKKEKERLAEIDQSLLSDTEVTPAGGFRNIARSTALQAMMGGSRGMAYGALSAMTNEIIQAKSLAMLAAWVPLGYMGYKEMQFLGNAWDANKVWSRNAMPLVMRSGDARFAGDFDNLLFEGMKRNLVWNDIKGEDYAKIVTTFQSRTPNRATQLDIGQGGIIDKIISNAVNTGLDPMQVADVVTKLYNRTGQRVRMEDILPNIESGLLRGLPGTMNGTTAYTAMQSIMQNISSMTEAIGSRVGTMGQGDVNRVTGFAGALYSRPEFRENAGQIMQMLDQSGKNWQDPMTMMLAMQQSGGNFSEAYRNIQRGGLLNNINRGRINMYRQMGLSNDMIASFMDIANGGNNIGFWEKFVSGQFTDAQLKKFYPSAEATKELGKSIDERSEERRRTPGYLAGTTQRVTELAEAKVGRTIQGVLAGSLESLQKALEGVTPYMGAVVTDLREYDRERSSKTPSGEKPPYGFRTLSAPLIPVEGEYDR